MSHLVDMIMGHDLLAEHTAETLPEALRIAAEWAEIAERQSGTTFRPSSYQGPDLVLDLVTRQQPDTPNQPRVARRVHVRIWKDA